MEDRRVTIVQYDLTSSEDEKDSDQTYVYSSSKLSPLSASEFLFEPPAEQHQGDHGEQNSVLVVESDSASDEAGPCTSASKRPRLSGHASSDLEIIANTAAAAPIYLESPSQSEEQDDEFSERPLLPDGASSDLEVIPSPAAAAAPICVSSSSESEDSEALVPGRKPYSMRLQELPASLREFLAEASAFFTSSHRLERAGQRVSLTTYGKAQERILCEYFLFASLKFGVPLRDALACLEYPTRFARLRGKRGTNLCLPFSVRVAKERRISSTQRLLSVKYLFGEEYNA